MEDYRIKIITTVIGAILGGSITGGITSFYDDSDEIVKRNEILISENSELKSTLSNKVSKISLLKRNIETCEENYYFLNEKFNKLSDDYEILNDKYKKCISSSGITENIGSIDLSKYSRLYRTGDNLKFDLTSKPMEIKFIRVSNRGPIIEICNCLNYLTVNSTAISSTNKNRYLLQLGKILKIRFTVNSCENNELIEPQRLEEVQLRLVSFNVEEQVFQIDFNRDFLIK
jgi:hypothetical protein